MLCDDQKCSPTQDCQVWNSRSLSPLSFVSSLQKGPQMPCQFPQASLPTFACRQECNSLVSDQLHFVDGHINILFRCHYNLTLGHMHVLLWWWKGLPSGGWWWACWRLGNIPWVFTMSMWTRNPTPCSCSFPLNETLCPSSVVVSTKVLPSHFTESKDVLSVPVHFMC